MSGNLLTVSGIDGSGKSTVAEGLAREFPDAILTREPTDGRYGSMLRGRLADSQSDPLINFFLFLCDRREHIEQVIRPAIKSGRLVICDRYADSTRAYQPVALTGVGAPFTSQAAAKAFIEFASESWTYTPAKTLYIDTSIETALSRAAGDEKYEKRSFLAAVRDNYNTLHERHDRIVRIDGEQSKEAVLSDSVHAVSDIL